MELKTLCFEKPGVAKTDATLEIARERAEALRLERDLVAFELGVESGLAIAAETPAEPASDSAPEPGTPPRGRPTAKRARRSRIKSCSSPPAPTPTPLAATPSPVRPRWPHSTCWKTA